MPNATPARCAMGALALATMFTFPVHAQTVAVAPVALPGIEVVGTTPLPGLVVPKDRVAAHVQTADSDDLDRTHVDTLTDFLKRRLGSVYINDIQNNPFQPDVNYRGFTASPLLGTPQGLSVYVDGVRINQPFGDVVSWDLLPRSAIDGIVLNPGSNPLFGLNTLGGALSVTTKDGLTHPGSSVQVTGGNYGRAAIEFETGGRNANGLDWFVTGNRFHDQGWRDASPSNVAQLFGKLGWKSATTRVTLSAAVARNDLVGNGFQEQRLLANDRASVYTIPDLTQNRSQMFNLVATHAFSDALSFSGNAWYRNIRTGTTNGDVSDDSLDQSVYQPSAAEQAALRAAGYTGFPTGGANAANTPFPKWRCIANKLLNDEPAEKCNGVINATHTSQHDEGFSGQLNGRGDLMGRANLFAAGLAFDASRVRFTQGSELGYLNPDRSVTGVGAFGDGGVTGGNVDGAPYDTRVHLVGRTGRGACSRRTRSTFCQDCISRCPAATTTLRSGPATRSCPVAARARSMATTRSAASVRPSD